MTLRSSELEATFDPRSGMAGKSLRHRGEELLDGDGIPLLYPWANRLAAFEYSALGKRVTLERGSPLIQLDDNGLPIHGLLFRWPDWQVEESDRELAATVDFGAQAALLRFFPFPHELRLLARVECARLEVGTTVNANQGAAVPVSFGFHPYFRLPGTPRQEWRIEIPVRERLLLDDRMIPTGAREPVAGLGGLLGDRSFDDGFISLEPGRPFVLEAGGRRLEVRFEEGFPFAQVYSPPGAAFICFEPMTAPTNALGTGKDLPVVEPGESFTARWSVEVTEAPPPDRSGLGEDVEQHERPHRRSDRRSSTSLRPGEKMGALSATTHYRTCPLCEATCGLEIEVDGDEILSIRGDERDVFSKGFICPKSYSLKELHADPDRLRSPLRRRPDGTFEEIGWDEAFAAVDQALTPILAEHGRDAVAVYLGNPTAHDYGALLYGRAAFRTLGSKNVYTATTVDQQPKQVSAGLMFGTALSVPVPDVDRCSYLLMLGANPLVSNGSLMTAPDMRGRLRTLRARGGKVVVIDPRRTRTAEEADEHHFIRPGTDAHFLIALVNVIVGEGLANPGTLADHCEGLDAIPALAEGFTPEAAAATCGIPAEDIRRIARELAAAKPAACYARIGTCTQEFGTLANWLVDVLNVLTGNLDRPGGAMFARAAAGARNTTGPPGSGRGVRIGRWRSRVRGLPEAFGELPVACLAEEIETPGEGQVRALVTYAGNPARSTPNSGRLEGALERLDFMVSVDIYLNETTRHADVVLPGSSPLERSHYDIALYQLAVRNVANFSPPIFEPNGDRPTDWQIMLRLAGIFGGQGTDADIEALDDFVAAGAVAEAAKGNAELAERDARDVLAELEPRRGPERLLDLLLRTGPYALELAELERSPHGIDLGPLEPRIPEVLRTASGKIELAPPEIVADVLRLRDRLVARNGSIVLIGRRELRSNNSWMHNLNVLVKGKERCTMHVHPDDAERLGLVDGARARVRSRVGEVEVPVEVTDAIMPGVVSIPHGWGHDAPGARLHVAATKAGTNSNALADEQVVEPVSGNAVLNGIPVEVAPV